MCSMWPINVWGDGGLTKQKRLHKVPYVAASPTSPTPLLTAHLATTTLALLVPDPQEHPHLMAFDFAALPEMLFSQQSESFALSFQFWFKCSLLIEAYS